MTHEELKYLLALKEVKGVGDILAKLLINETGSAQEVFRLSAGKLLKIPKISEKLAKEIVSFSSFDRIEKEIAWCDDESIQIIPFNDHAYPRRLNECHDAPLILFKKGNANLNPQRIISIVGTRSHTEYGQSVTEQIIEKIADMDVTIVSGLAIGIDGIAHKKSLELNIPTIGVLGHPLNQIYPRQHQSLAKRMTGNGALVTEFSRSSDFDRTNFPMRNRIVAGMCDATILIESGDKGGSMITAEIAHSYGREVFAVPGKWTDPTAQGPNRLIKTLKAQILTNPDDLPEVLGWKINQQLLIDSFYDKKSKYQHLEEEEMKIAGFMNVNDSISIDSLHNATDMPMSQLSSVLLSMEFKGVIKALPGKRFQLK